MEYIKVQLTKENIKYVKDISSFAKVLNSLIEVMGKDKLLEDKIKNQIKSISNGI